MHTTFLGHLQLDTGTIFKHATPPPTCVSLIRLESDKQGAAAAPDGGGGKSAESEEAGAGKASGSSLELLSGFGLLASVSCGVGVLAIRFFVCVIGLCRCWLLLSLAAAAGAIVATHV